MVSRVSENLFHSLHGRRVCQLSLSSPTSRKTLNINATYYCAVSTEALWILTMSTQAFSFFTVSTQALWLFTVCTEALWLFILSTEALDPVQPPIRRLPSAPPPQLNHRSLCVTVHVCLSSGDVQESVELSLHK